MPNLSRALTLLTGGLLLAATARAGVNRWTTTGPWGDDGLQGQPVRHLALDEDRGFVYASGDLDVFRSSGIGQGWTSFRPPGINDNPCSARIVSIETMRTPEGLALYAATSSFAGVCYPAGGLWRSFDSGASWSPSLAGPTSGHLGSLAVDPLERRHSYLSWVSCRPFRPFFICSVTSIWASEDGGENWSERSNQSASVLSVDPNTPRVVYGKYLGFLGQSRDYGATWSEETGISSPSAVLVSTSQPARVLVATSDGPVYRSFNYGRTWQRLSAEPPAPILTLAEDPRDPDVLMAGTNGAGVLRSEDGGETWEPDNRGIENLTVYDLLFDADGRVLYAATDQGVFSRETRSTRVIAPRQ